MLDIPIYITVVFGLTTLATLLLFYWVIKNSADDKVCSRANFISIGLLIWLGLQALITLQGVYISNLEVLPPRLLLFGLLPNIIAILALFLTQKGRAFIDSLPLDKVTAINIVRIPVEFVLLWLSFQKVIPSIMTFEGWNFDILAGLTAPLIIYFGFRKKSIGKNLILFWNVLGFCLLTTIVVIALFSAPFPLQAFAFEQPNIAVLNFPFSWLPTFIVPIVYFGHLVSIRQLTKTN